MPSRPPSPFETILRRTHAAGGPAGADGGETAAARVGSTPWYVPETRRQPHGGADAPAGFASRYQEPEEVPDDASPPVPRSIDPDEIARELDLAGCPDIAALRERRRLFAAANHPDRVDGRLSDNATRRMMIANRLIDQEIGRRRMR